MENKNKKMDKEKMQKLIEAALLTAVVIIMAFTPLGYLKTPGLEITFITVPVIIGAVMCGPAWGAVLGGVFGITSFIQCFGMSQFGAAVLQINPVFTFIVCVPTRILMGFFTGLIYKGFSKKLKEPLSVGISSLIGPFLNTVFFTSTLILLFGKTDLIKGFMAQTGSKNMLLFAVAFVGLQGLIEALVCFAISTAVILAVKKALKSRIKN